MDTQLTLNVRNQLGEKVAELCKDVSGVGVGIQIGTTLVFEDKVIGLIVASSWSIDTAGLEYIGNVTATLDDSNNWNVNQAAAYVLIGLIHDQHCVLMEKQEAYPSEDDFKTVEDLLVEDFKRAGMTCERKESKA